MSWRTVVISNSAKLDYRMGYMIVRQSEIVKIHLSEIALLLIESTAVSLTSALLAELTKKKIKIIFCDEKRNPSSELIPFYGSHDTSAKVRVQVGWRKEIKMSVWTEIVTEKIRKQKELLQKLNYLNEAGLLQEYIREIQFGDATNREGHAAKVYFNALFGKEFSRTNDVPINAALNYGYGIILSLANREIVSNGYITQNIVDQSIDRVGYNIIYKDIDIKNCLKMLNASFEKCCDNSLECLLEYLELFHEVMGIDLFVLINVTTFFSKEELVYLYQQAEYKKYFLLLIDRDMREIDFSKENVLIIDKDACVFDGNLP